MRQVVLDTETTGLSPSEGHRIIEIGAVEVIDRRQSGEKFHCYLNPERESDAGALEIHGLNADFLADKPVFAEVAQDFLAFIRGAQLVIHNAPFDIAFLNAELARLEGGAVEQHAEILDSLVLARELHPGMANSLNALCRRYQVDNTGRELHGALLDAELLAEVYLAMTGGQTSLSFRPESRARRRSDDSIREDDKMPEVVVPAPNEEELKAHQQRLEAIKESSGRCVWLESSNG